MDLSQIIQPGMSKEETYRVEEEYSAIHVGSGSVRVLATPWMIAFMERVARKFVGELLPAGFSSVGVRVDVQHLAPSPVGSQVTARAEVISVEGGKVNFHVEAWDEQEKIGAGSHQRVVIDEARFLRRVAAKMASLQNSGGQYQAPDNLL
jgi:fluoroacetyl-CoA thioesterase